VGLQLQLPSFRRVKLAQFAPHPLNRRVETEPARHSVPGLPHRRELFTGQIFAGRSLIANLVAEIPLACHSGTHPAGARLDPVVFEQ